MRLAEMGKPIDILLVEDNPGDVRLTQETFKESKILNTMHVVRDGVEAMAFLRQEGEYADATRPDLILLDLNLPRKDGREVLEEIKDDDQLRRIPVVVLPISYAEEDICGPAPRALSRRAVPEAAPSGPAVRARAPTPLRVSLEV